MAHYSRFKTLQRRRSKALSSLCRLGVLSLSVAAVAGCGGRTTPVAPVSGPGKPLPDNKALWRLEQIRLPASEAATTLPTTVPVEPAPLDALQLFAQARSALQANQRLTAVQLLDQALAIDPDSYELHVAMGQAAIGTAMESRALPSLSRAVGLHPDGLEGWVQLARLQYRQDEFEQAIGTLRQARLTSEYHRSSDAGIAVDFLLARSLQAGGYDTAALGAYEHLLARVRRLSPMFRGPGDLMQFVFNPELIHAEICKLHIRLGEYDKALVAIDKAIAEGGDDQHYALTRLRLLMRLNRVGEARAYLPQVISRYGTHGEIPSVLREVFAADGGEQAAIVELRRALEARGPDEHLSYALAELLLANQQPDEARDVLHRIVRQTDYAPEPVKRLFAYYESQDQTLSAASLLIEASARRPDQLSEFAPSLARLARLSRSGHIRLRDLQQLRVEHSAEAARLYWIARLADNWNRNELARAMLEKSVRVQPPYAPAFRALITHYWVRHDWDEQRKLKSSQELLMLAQMHGDQALSAELGGLIALHQKNRPQAAAGLLEAMRLGTQSPDVLLAYSLVELMEGNVTEAERNLLSINERHPFFEQAYVALIGFYMERGSINGAMRTLQRWLSADPRNPTARLYQASILLRTQRQDAAEKLLLELFDEYADNTEVLHSIQQLYAQTGRLQQFISLLELKRQGRPDIRELAERLVDIYAQQQRLAEAQRVLNDLHQSATGDSDLLYYVSYLYNRLDDSQSARQVLEEVLRVDASHSSAANDLGYFLADQGQDLDRAEKLIRLAVHEEPDNQAFLDSLGWVMYKRGQFQQAVELLRKAISQTVSPDPIVLDHLGDALYRLGEGEEAVRTWEESARRLGEYPAAAGEIKSLQLRLQTKLRQHRQNQPPSLAPLGT